MLVVCTTEATAGSMIHTSVSPFSAMRANPRVMKPQKYDAAKVTRNDVKEMPKSSPKYLARSPMSIFKATRSIYGFLGRKLRGIDDPERNITVFSAKHPSECLSSRSAEPR